MRQVTGAAVVRAVVGLPRLSGRALSAALPIKIRENAEKKLFENYIAENLRIIAENTANFAGGKFFKNSYQDIISPPKEIKPGETVARLREVLGGE